jgi:hypothetical protein
MIEEGSRFFQDLDEVISYYTASLPITQVSSHSILWKKQALKN